MGDPAVDDPQIGDVACLAADGANLTVQDDTVVGAVLPAPNETPLRNTI